MKYGKNYPEYTSDYFAEWSESYSTIVLTVFTVVTVLTFCACVCAEGGQGRTGPARDCWNAWITRNSSEYHSEYNLV